MLSAVVPASGLAGPGAVAPASAPPGSGAVAPAPSPPFPGAVAPAAGLPSAASQLPSAADPREPCVIVEETVKTHGLAGVLYRVFWPRLACPFGYHGREPPILPPTTSTDRWALVLAVLLAWTQATTHALVPFAPVDEAHATFVHVWPFVVTVGLAMSPCTPAAITVVDATLGGAHPALTGQTVALPLVLSFLVALLMLLLFAIGDFFPLIGMVIVATWLTAVVIVFRAWRATWLQLRRLLHFTSLIVGSSVLPMLYLIAFYAWADWRPLIVIVFELLAWLLKRLARRRWSALGLVLSETFMDGSIHSISLFSIPLMSTTVFVVLLASHAVGAFLPSAVVWYRGHHAVTPLEPGKLAEQARVARLRFFLSNTVYLVTTTNAALLFGLSRIGPNADTVTPGLWTDEEFERAMSRCVLLVALYALLLVARRQHWPEGLNLLVQYLALFSACLSGAVNLSAIFQCPHGQVMFYVYPVDGYST